MGRPRLRTDELRRTFVDAATVAVERDGVEALTTRGVAEATGSSLAALNELFGGKAGLINAVALDGFAALAGALDEVGTAADPHAHLVDICRCHRAFSTGRPNLSRLMYATPFPEFDPGPADLGIASRVRRHYTGGVARLLGSTRSDPTVIDVSIGLISLLNGLDHQERSGTLGTSPASAERRWLRAIERYLAGAVALA